MPLWLTSLLAGIGALFSAAGQWMKDLHTTNLQRQAMTQQQTTDALKGESDALEQVDRVSAAVDATNPSVLNDPNNLDR